MLRRLPVCERETSEVFFWYFFNSPCFFALKTANESRPLEVVRPAVTRHRRSWTERGFLDFGKEEVWCINTIMLSWNEAFRTRLKKEPATRIFNQHYHIIFQPFSIYSIKEAKCAKATSTFWRNVRKNVVGRAWFKKNWTILAVSHYQWGFRWSISSCELNKTQWKPLEEKKKKHFRAIFLEAMHLEKMHHNFKKEQVCQSLCHKRRHRKTKLKWKKKIRSRQSHCHWVRRTCNARERKHRLGEQQQQKKKKMAMTMEEKDVKLTPLWIFPNTVSYRTPSLGIECFWQQKPRLWCDRGEKSKGGHLVVLLFAGGGREAAAAGLEG